MYYDPTGHLEEKDITAYKAGLLSPENYNKIVELSLKYDETDDLSYKNLYRYQAVMIRINTYDPNYVDTYDYTYGGKLSIYKMFPKTISLDIEDLLLGYKPLKDDLKKGFVNPKIDTPVEMPQLPWRKPINNPMKPGIGSGGSGSGSVLPILTAILLALDIVMTPTVVNEGEDHELYVIRDFEESMRFDPELEDKDKRKEWINFDAGTASSLCSSLPQASQLRQQIGLLVDNKQIVMTKTAYKEFQGNLKASTNDDEKIRAKVLMSRIKVIDDNPSQRFKELKITGNVDTEEDKIIFGTGDKLGILTVTTDSKFVRGASAQKIKFNYVDMAASQKVTKSVTNYPGGVKVFIIDPVPWDKDK